MNPSTVSSTGVQPLALTVSETRSRAPTKEGVAGDLLKVSQVNYGYQPYEPDYSYTPTYQPYDPSYASDGSRFTPTYPHYGPMPTENDNTFFQGYGYSAKHAADGRPNDAGLPTGRAPGTPGDVFVKPSQPHGSHSTDVSRWTGVVVARGGKPVTANLSLAVDGTAAVAFEISSKGPSRFSADEQAYWKALGFQKP